MQKTRSRFRSTKVTKKIDPLNIPQSSFNEKFENVMEDIVIDFDERKTEQNNSENETVKREESLDVNTEQQIVSTVEIQSQQLKAPYEFIGVSSPSIRTIVLPWFQWKSITFGMTVVMFLLFIALFAAHEIRPKSETSWGCLLFDSQNKFFPRLRQSYQFWRIPVSGLFHSNFSHLILNLVGLQLYGYFVQWYIGKIKLIGLIILTIINAHFLSCLTNIQTVSTTSSGILYALMAIKILFFIKYRNYQPIQSKRIALYGLFGLIFSINILVLIVGGNVDIGGHIGGLLTGLLYGTFFYQFQLQTTKTKILKYSSIFLLSALTIAFIGICFGIQTDKIIKANISIDNIC